MRGWQVNVVLTRLASEKVKITLISIPGSEHSLLSVSACSFGLKNAFTRDLLLPTNNGGRDHSAVEVL